MAACMRCGRTLTGDETAIYRRLVFRGASEFLCKNCLAKKFGCDEKKIDEKNRVL